MPAVASRSQRMLRCHGTISAQVRFTRMENDVKLQLGHVAAEIDEIMASAQDKPEAIELLAGAIGKLRLGLHKIAMEVDASEERLPPLSIAGLR